MNDLEVKQFYVKYTMNDESNFIVTLTNNKIFLISLWSFYEFASTKDERLAQYGGKFYEWEQLTKDLTELDYDFVPMLNIYIQQFSEEQMEEFTMTKEQFEDLNYNNLL